jgi:uncharacterized DUF497 family protein
MLCLGAEFEWDPNKEARNRAKHGVSFKEAETVFDDPLSDTYRDPDHSLDEWRYLTVGRSDAGRPLVVAHTIGFRRGRIISARELGPRERTLYEEGLDD